MLILCLAASEVDEADISAFPFEGSTCLGSTKTKRTITSSTPWILQVLVVVTVSVDIYLLCVSSFSRCHKTLTNSC